MSCAHFAHLFLISVFSLCVSAQQSVPGFSATRSDQAPGAFTKMSAIGAAASTYLTFDNTRFNQKLVWSVWLQKVDGTLYPSLGPDVPSESLLVYFQKSADENFVLMFESPSTPDAITGDNLIDRFPIVSTDSKTTTFDFARGLPRRLFRSWINPEYTADFKIAYATVYNFKNMNDVVTFGETLKIDDARFSTVIMRHAFRLFDLGLTPLKITQPLQLGLFTAASTVDKDSTEPQTVRRFDINKPITMYISSNTPDQAVRDLAQGLKWWNLAFGFDFVKVEVLSKPVDWADARMNILQWSDNPEDCFGGATAIGPSEVNPVTGEIYSGKILVCGSTIAQMYKKGVNPAIASENAFMAKAMSYIAAHEFGHVLGFTHNFKGKLYRDPAHLNVINSTVMDYPFPEEILAYSGVGVADFAKVQVTYLEPGNPEAIKRLRELPYCSDEDTATDPACNAFVPGGYGPALLATNYLNKLRTGAAMVEMENAVRGVILKRFFGGGEPLTVIDFDMLMTLYPGSKLSLAEKTRDTARAMRAITLSLPDNRVRAIVTALSTQILPFSSEFADRRALVEALAAIKTAATYEALENLHGQTRGLLATVDDQKVETGLLRLEHLLDKLLADFWEDPK